MATYVTWPNIQKYHSISVRQSGPFSATFQPGSQTGHLTPTSSGKVVTRCGREVPETNTAVSTLQNIGGDSIYCRSCHRSRTM